MFDVVTIDFEPFWVSIRLAGATVIALLVIALPFAFWLSQTQSRVKPLFEALLTLPLALPPTVIGFYYLYALGKENTISAKIQEICGIELVFSFWGLVLGSIIYCIPFMVQPLKNGFESVPQEIRDSAKLDGAGSWRYLLKIALPLSLPSLVTGITLSFVHALGEFGLVMMIGGNIAGETRTASIALYDAVQSMDYAKAHQYALGLLFVAVIAALPLYRNPASLIVFRRRSSNEKN